MDRIDALLTVSITLVIIGIDPALRFVAVLGALLLLTPGVGRRLLERLYGPRLTPQVIGLTGPATSPSGAFTARGLSWRFYRAYPRFSIDVHREDAVKALNGLIQVLPLDAGLEVAFIRMGASTYVGVGHPQGFGIENTLTILNRYFLLEPADAGTVRRLIGGPVKPLVSDVGFAVLFLAGVIGCLLIFGSPLRINWPFGLATSILLATALVKAGRGLGVTPRPHPSFGTAVTHSDALFRELGLDAVLASAEQNVGRDFVLIIGRPRIGRESLARRYAQAVNRWVVRQRGEYVPRIQALDIAHRRALGGEAFITFSIYGSLTLPGMVVGRALRHWLFGPSLDGLSMDVCSVPVFYGESVIAQGDELVVSVGRDEYGTPVVIGLNSAPSPHALIVGPTGSGKSWTAVSLMLRAHRLGVGLLVIDPQGEYPGYLARAGVGFNVYDALDAFIDWLEPVGSPIAHADVIAQAVGFSYGSRELANTVFRDLVRLYNAYPRYPGLYEALDWLVRNGEAQRVWLVARELMPKSLVNVFDLTGGVNVLVLRRVMNHREFASLLMQALLARAYYEYLQRPFVEGLNTIIAFDEAYLIIESPILELVVRGVRKMGLGVWVITQTLGDVKPATLQNFGFTILLQGLSPHAKSVGRAFMLDVDNIRWLGQGNNPRIYGGEYTPGILIYPPRPRRVFIKLEPIKG